MKLIMTIGLACAMLLAAQDKPRVFVTDSQSWQVTGGSGAGWNHEAGGAWGALRGGARPQTAEIYKAFGENCPAVVMTNLREKADYVVTLDHEGGNGLVRKDNKVAVFSKDGDMIHSGSTRSLGNAVRDACKAIESHK